MILKMRTRKSGSTSPEFSDDHGTQWTQSHSCFTSRILVVLLSYVCIGYCVHVVWYSISGKKVV